MDNIAFADVDTDMDGNDDDAHGTGFGVDAGLQKTSAKTPSDSVPLPCVRERVFGLIQPR